MKAPEPALLALIARELATEAYTLEQVLKRYELTAEDFETLYAANPYYKRVLEDYTKEWHALGSTHKRLAFAAAAALEEKLPVLADRMGSRSSELSDAVAAAKLFRELAGIAAPAPNTNAQSGTPFSIQINFGDRKVSLETRSVSPGESLLEGQAAGQAIPTGEPPSSTDSPPLQHLLEGATAVEEVVPSPSLKES